VERGRRANLLEPPSITVTVDTYQDGAGGLELGLLDEPVFMQIVERLQVVLERR